MPAPTLPPDLLAAVLVGVRPLIDQAVASAIARERATSRRLELVTGRVTSTDGPFSTAEPDDSPGAEVYPTRVGGDAPAEGDSTLILYAPNGQTFAIGTLPPPA